MKEEAGPIHIGTSGWHYGHWKGPFYPRDLPAGDFLSFYAQHFHTVEINNTFYQLPAEETVRTWRDTVEPHFVFSVKASRYITHMKKLKDPQEPVRRFLDRIATLGDRLGPILFQLPPRWHFDRQRLRSFLQALPSGFRYTFELRDPSWLNEQAYDILAEHGAALCIYDLRGHVSPKEITADFVYVRLHGPYGAYRGSYSAQDLAGWAGAFSTWASRGKEVFCYFDNDESGYAVQNALALQGMVGWGRRLAPDGHDDP
jgi:uncharacterized protein YecE (DUF72 family)